MKFFNTNYIFTKSIKNIIEKLQDKDKIGIAFSGGLDSTVLLNIASKFLKKKQYIALHVHHGLSSNADKWKEHCQKSANLYKIDIDISYINVPINSKLGIEASARIKRYDALYKMCKKNSINFLWLAHNADDQAETIFFQFMRGTGIAGLSGMPVITNISQNESIQKIRPLLYIPRIKILEYAKFHMLNWVEDESNRNNIYSRNLLRNKIFPIISESFPWYRNSMLKIAKHSASAQRLLDAIAYNNLKNISRNNGLALSKIELLKLDNDNISNIIRYWMKKLGFPSMSTNQLYNLLHQLKNCKDNNQLYISYYGSTLRNYKNLLFWEKKNNKKIIKSLILNKKLSISILKNKIIWNLPQWNGLITITPTLLKTVNTLPISLIFQKSLIAKSRIGGEKMQIGQNRPNRTLKNLFQEYNIPSWERNIPLIYIEKILFFVPFIGYNYSLIKNMSSKEDIKEKLFFTIQWDKSFN